MATKKTQAAIPEEVKEAEEAAQAEETEAEKPASEWDEYVEMYVPRKPKGDDQQYYVCVNDRRFMVPANGKVQSLPKPVALILQDGIAAEEAAAEFAEHFPNRQPGQ